MMHHLVRTCAIGLLLLVSGCDLLNQTAVIPPEPSGSNVRRPLALSKPDSLLKLLTYLFDRHRPQDALEYGDLLYSGYLYRYDDPTDSTDLVLYRADEIRIYQRIFAYYQNISAEFREERRWTEYGSRRAIPAGTPAYQTSETHPEENWVVLEVFGDMSFSRLGNDGIQQTLTVRQEFDIAFRVEPAKKDSTWQVASWTDHALTYTAKTSRAE